MNKNRWSAPLTSPRRRLWERHSGGLLTRLADSDQYRQETDSMRIETVRIDTDTTPLDGLLYTPEDRPVTGVVQLMHACRFS